MVSKTSEDAPAPACGPHMLLPVGRKQAAAWLPGLHAILDAGELQIPSECSHTAHLNSRRQHCRPRQRLPKAGQAAMHSCCQQPGSSCLLCHKCIQWSCIDCAGWLLLLGLVQHLGLAGCQGVPQLHQGCQLDCPGCSCKSAGSPLQGRQHPVWSLCDLGDRPGTCKDALRQRCPSKRCSSSKPQRNKSRSHHQGVQPGQAPQRQHSRQALCHRQQCTAEAAQQAGDGSLCTCSNALEGP